MRYMYISFGLAIVLALVFSRVRAGTPTECCICDDFSTDPAQRCDVQGICGKSNFFCPEYCETARTFVNKKWYTTRRCGQEATCVNHWYHTVTSLGCVNNTRGEPENGTTCYKCCKVTDRFHPHFCVDNPDNNFVTFPVTTQSTTPTTTPVAVVTTKPSTTTTTSTQSTTSNSQPSSNAASNGTVCEVGRDGHYNITVCGTTTPLCMNTVVLQTNLTIIKKSCESDVLCDQDWWKLTRARPGCMKADFSSLPVRDQGLVCHYCCKSSNANESACNTEVIPDDVKDIITRVDGGWSGWSLWQGCTSDCKGIRVRIRTCSNPFPGPNGRFCVGNPSETETCGPTNCHVAGSGTETLVG